MSKIALLAFLLFPAFAPVSMAEIHCVREADSHKHYFCDGSPEVEQLQVVPQGNEDECFDFCRQKGVSGACNLVRGEVCSFISREQCESAGGKLVPKEQADLPIVSGPCASE